MAALVGGLIGGIGVTFRIVAQRNAPVYDASSNCRPTRKIDARVIGG